MEFAYGEQRLKEVYDDEEIIDHMDDILVLFEALESWKNTFRANKISSISCWENTVLIDLRKSCGASTTKYVTL